jgi:hypothetical protein
MIQAETIGAEPLSQEERRELVEREGQYQEALGQYWVRGTALNRIRRRELYREEFATFAEYCEERWDLEPRRAQQLIIAAEVRDGLENSFRNLTKRPIGSLRYRNETVNLLPKNERQIRPLTFLLPEYRFPVWISTLSAHPDPERVRAEAVELFARLALQRPHPAGPFACWEDADGAYEAAILAIWRNSYLVRTREEPEGSPLSDLPFLLPLPRDRPDLKTRGDLSRLEPEDEERGRGGASLTFSIPPELHRDIGELYGSPLRGLTVAYDLGRRFREQRINPERGVELVEALLDHCAHTGTTLDLVLAQLGVGGR